MQDKKSFGAYLLKKRKEANLTQEELAAKLYVIPTTISKWERGITYPDITMITRLCEYLNISEHEFFTACDDESLNQEKKEVKHYRTLKKIIMYSLNIGYLIAIITCLICNLVIDKTLSWFLIVIIGIAISFTITTLPFYLSKNKYLILKLASIITLLIYLLLFTINYINEYDWLIASFIIATFELSLMWLSVLIWTFTKINKYSKISWSLILLALSLALSNIVATKVLNLTNNGSNIPNIIGAFILLIIALFINIKNKIRLK